MKPLRPRNHHPLPWDERYAPYIRRAGFLPLTRLVQARLPSMIDSAALTALVDRWRPETHTFHLPAGEMTVTLQDVAMILGLPINGRVVSGTITPDGWRDRVEMLVGVRPDEPPEGNQDKRPTGVSSGWMTTHFGHPPPLDATDAVVERFARAWLWHMLAGFLFPDGSGNTVSWMWLDILGQDWEAIGTYSWGSGVLAWLYRQMCDACRRSSDNTNLGGCAYLLQVWMWEHLPVGRPSRRPPGVRSFAYLLQICSFCYLRNFYLWNRYVCDLETKKCTLHRDYWLSVLPLICFYIVEYHLPNRVMRQFGIKQKYPPEYLQTSHELHKYVFISIQFSYRECVYSDYIAFLLF